MGKLSVAKLTVSSIPLVLDVEGHKLELKLSWNMRAVAIIETRLREKGVSVNILQRPAKFWTDIDCTSLAIAVWACAQQSQVEYSTEAGFEVIESYLVPDTYDAAVNALKEAFLESLSTERREMIKKAERGESTDKENPTPAPVAK